MFGNSLGKSTKTYNGGKNVFHKVSGVYPVGGKIDVTSYSVGDVIPAGTPVVLDMATKTITIISSVTAENKATVNGLLRHDIPVDELAKSNNIATGSVVYAAEVFVNRLAVDITLCLPTLPQIVAIKEA